MIPKLDTTLRLISRLGSFNMTLHQAESTALVPPRPLGPPLLRCGEGPLDRRGSCLAYGLVGHDSGGELSLRLLKAGIGLPVQAVDLEQRGAQYVDTRYVYQFIVLLCEGENDTLNLILWLLFGAVVYWIVDGRKKQGELFFVLNS